MGYMEPMQNWDKAELEEWGLELDWPADISIGTDEFILPDGDKAPQQIFTPADRQTLEQIKMQPADIKESGGV